MVEVFLVIEKFRSRHRKLFLKTVASKIGRN